MSVYEEFKIVYHLVGEQTIPVFLTAIQFPVDAVHYLLTTRTPKTTQAAENILKALQEKGRSGQIFYLGDENAAVSFPVLQKAMEDILAETNPKEYSAAFDLTGGTKPMSILALLMSGRRRHLKTFYLDFNGRKLIPLNNLNASDSRGTLEHSMELADFIILGGMTFKTAEQKCVSEEFLSFLYNKRNVLQMHQEAFSRTLPGTRKTGENKEQLFRNTLEALLEKIGKQEWERFAPEIADYGLPVWQAQARFLAGGWFEQYVYSTLKESPGIRDIRFNATLAFPDAPSTDAQEFDVVYTDGFSLIILECKAGRLLQEHIQKLENLRGKFSGALGKSALVTLNPPETKKNQKSGLLKKIQHGGTIAAFCNTQGIQMLKAHLFDFEGGKIYGETRKA